MLEHIPPAETDQAIANLCAATDRLLLSTTPDDFGEADHLNVQPPEAWAAALAGEGFFRDARARRLLRLPLGRPLHAQRGAPAETVRRYDRAWKRLRREADQLRDSLLSAQQQLAELERPARTAPSCWPSWTAPARRSCGCATC